MYGKKRKGLDFSFLRNILPFHPFHSYMHWLEQVVDPVFHEITVESKQNENKKTTNTNRIINEDDERKIHREETVQDINICILYVYLVHNDDTFTIKNH